MCQTLRFLQQSSKGLFEIKRTLITPFAVENVREDRMRKIPPFMFWTPS